MREADKNPNKKIICRLLAYVIGMLLMNGTVLYFINEIILDGTWNQRYLFISSFLMLLIFIYAVVERKQLFSNIVCLFFLLICFLLSAMLLLLPDVYVNVPIWLFGGIFVAALLNRNMGMLYVYYFVLQAIYLQSDSIRGLILHFTVATILCVMIPFMKKWLSMLYVMVITCATILCSTILINRLELKPDMLLDAVSILVIYLACIFATMVLRCILYQPLHTDTMQEYPNQSNEDIQKGLEYLSLVANQTNENFGDITQIKLAEENEPKFKITETGSSEINSQKLSDDVKNEQAIQQIDFSKYCNENSDLMTQLKTQKKAAFVHSLLVGTLACEAAEVIGAMEEFAKAIGYYHEIGKINEGNCSEQTLLIAKEYNFPEPLLSALTECNSQNGMETKSREAAIVMLTDTILTTYLYLRNNKNKTAVEKIVDHALGLRITHGQLNCSGLSVADCADLREYFVNQLTAQDRRRGILS